MIGKSDFSKTKNAQEEIVGFVIIIVIVSVALLILLGFLISSPDKEAAESYQIESFIQSALQYTSNCDDYMEFLSVQELIIACEEEKTCLNGEYSCDILNTTLINLIEKGWNVNEESAVKGYLFKIIVEDEEKLSLEKGNKTKNYKGDFQDFYRQGIDYEVSLNVYY